jgi:hypothetical protein
MVAPGSLWIEVRGSRWLTFMQGSFLAACAMALHLSASALAGPFAGVALALAGTAWLAGYAHGQARGRLCELWLDEDGSVEWYDRIGRVGKGQVVAAVRVGGGWVSLSAQPDREATRALQAMQAGTPGGSRAGGRGLHARMWRPFELGMRPRAWLLAADALDPETFRALAVRVPHIPRGRP